VVVAVILVGVRVTLGPVLTMRVAVVLVVVVVVVVPVAVVLVVVVPVVVMLVTVMLVTVVAMVVVAMAVVAMAIVAVCFAVLGLVQQSIGFFERPFVEQGERTHRHAGGFRGGRFDRARCDAFTQQGKSFVDVGARYPIDKARPAGFVRWATDGTHSR